MPEEIFFYSRKVDYGWLSNFWRCPQTVDGITYPTNEHYYQSEKAGTGNANLWVRAAKTPYEAMKRGRSLKGMDFMYEWDEYKLKAMLKGLRAKFQDPELRQKLLDTGYAILHEDSPTDMFWGVKGKDMLGKLLMQVREEIRQEPLNSR